jgi:hypothetical protein
MTDSLINDRRGGQDGRAACYNVVVVVAKSPASAIFEPGEHAVMNFEGAPASFAVKFWTNYGGKFEVPVPLYFCAEGRGPAESLDDAGKRFANAARAGSTILALIANADLGLLQPELIFDASPERDQHEFLQIVLPEQPLRAVPNRRIDVEATSAVGTALSAHPELIRLRRAISQYSLALSLWQPGHEIQCLAHLYMGVEALTKAQLRQHLLVRSWSEDDLIREWQIERKQLDAEVRRRLSRHSNRNLGCPLLEAKRHAPGLRMATGAPFHFPAAAVSVH